MMGMAIRGFTTRVLAEATPTIDTTRWDNQDSHRRVFATTSSTLVSVPLVAVPPRARWVIMLAATKATPSAATIDTVATQFDAQRAFSRTRGSGFLRCRIAEMMSTMGAMNTPTTGMNQRNPSPQNDEPDCLGWGG